MIADDVMVTVQNLTDSKVAYIVPESNVLREFTGQQIRQIAAGELRSLYSTVGGKTLIEHYLGVKEKELASEFNISDDSFNHEYNWSMKDVDTVLKYGSLDALKDALDFAPRGIIELIVDRAVALKIPDNNKLTAIEEATGKNVATMIRLDTELAEDKQNDEKPKGRRVNSDNKAPAVERRAE